MTTVIELDRESKPARVFHRVGMKSWTHAADKATRATCETCEKERGR